VRVTPGVLVIVTVGVEVPVGRMVAVLVAVEVNVPVEVGENV
jgi:hypothetical protein